MARISRKNLAETPKTELCFNTALYVRLSVEDGHGRSNSIENQQMILNDYISDKPEFKVCKTYIDNGLSGMSYDRPSFQRMLSDIESGRINCVIVKDLSRLGRNAIDTGFYVEQYFVQRKIRFIAVNDMYDSNDEKSSQNGILLPIKNMVNEAYALDIGKKIKAQAHQAMLDGEYIGARAPFGYKKDPNNCHKLIIDEITAPIVRQIFEWAADGIGVNTITVKLNEIGAVTSSVYKNQTSEIGKRYKINKNWTSLSVAHILDNPVYVGDMVQGKSRSVEHKQQDVSPDEYIIVHDTHEAIISRELFQKVNEIRSAVRKEYKGKQIDHYTENIFKGKVFCPHCGKPLHRQRDKRKTMPDVYVLHCLSPTRVSKTACIGVCILEQDVIDYVSDALKKELSDLKKSNARKDRFDILKQRKTDKQRELNRVQSLIRGLYENLVKGIISYDDYVEFKSSYTEQASALKVEIELINTEIVQIERGRKQLAETGECAKVFKKSNTLTAELIDCLIERIEVSHEREIHITFRGKECL